MSNLEDQLDRQKTRLADLRDEYFERAAGDLCKLASQLADLSRRFQDTYENLDRILEEARESDLSEEKKEYFEEVIIGRIQNQSTIFDTGLQRVVDQLQELCDTVQRGQIPEE
jgi:ABC-type transporter Mla subunit MlaD